MAGKALVLANGELGSVESLSAWMGDVRLIVAADGGLRHAFALGLQPHVLIGDLDSAPNELIQLGERTGMQIVRYPVHKDMTDLELALDYASERAEEIVVLGALGGRLDHELANILGLGRFTRPSTSITIVGNGHEVFLLTSNATLKGDAGDLVTLLPLSETVDGITSEGLEYPLRHERLVQGSSRGVSNVMMHDRATVTVESGRLLVIHTRSSFQQNHLSV